MNPLVFLAVSIATVVALPSASSVDTVSTLGLNLADVVANNKAGKELVSLLLSVQPQATAQLARIGSNIGALAALDPAGTHDLSHLPPHILDQIASLISSGQKLLAITKSIQAESYQELDNVAAVSNYLLDQIPEAMQFVPHQLRSHITELADATKQLSKIFHSLNPRLRGFIGQSFATQEQQMAAYAANVRDARARSFHHNSTSYKISQGYDLKHFSALTNAASSANGLFELNQIAAVIPNNPGKELISLLLSVQPQVTTQLARIGNNIGVLAELNSRGTSSDLSHLPSHILDQIASLISSGQRLLEIIESIQAQSNRELDNVAAVSNSLLDQISEAMPYVPPQLKGQITELAEASKQLSKLFQSLNPRLRALTSQSLATQKHQMATHAANVRNARSINKYPSSPFTGNGLNGLNELNQIAGVVPNNPGKELAGLLLSVQPQVMPQLARIGANIGALTAFNAAGTSNDLSHLPPHILDQIGSLIGSGQRLLDIIESIQAETNRELDNVAAVSNSLLDQIPEAMPYVPPQLSGQITELAGATRQLSQLFQSLNPRLRALTSQSLATQRQQMAQHAATIRNARSSPARNIFPSVHGQTSPSIQSVGGTYYVHQSPYVQFATHNGKKK